MEVFVMSLPHHRDTIVTSLRLLFRRTRGGGAARDERRSTQLHLRCSTEWHPGSHARKGITTGDIIIIVAWPKLTVIVETKHPSRVSNQAQYDIGLGMARLSKDHLSCLAAI